MNTLGKVIEKLKEKIPHFEVRNEQLQMMETVLLSMKEGKKAAIHAPTGTGKSLGYLIPFVAMKLNDPFFKMTISTFTISLQEQLQKEMELIISIYDELKEKEKPSITYTVLKGKSNYFCERRFLDARKTVPFDIIDEMEERVEDLKNKKEVLDRQKIGIKMTQNQWSQMNVEHCKREECPFFKECSFYKDYYGSVSDIVIINHSLFFNRHFYVEGSWDHYAYNVFDEAHKIEKVILDASTFSLSEQTIENWQFQAVTIGYKFDLDQEKIGEWVETYFQKHKIIESFKKGTSKLLERVKEPAVDYKDLRFSKENFAKMVDALSKWQKEMFESFKKIADYELLELEETFQEKSEKDEKRKKTLKEEIDFWGMNLFELRDFSNLLKKEDSLLWVEKDKNKLTYKVTPSSVSSIPSPFVKGTLLTSGTLAERGSCKSFGIRLNIELDTDLVLPTTFNLAEKTLIHVAKDISPRKYDYEMRLEGEIEDLIKLGDMKTFVLFTSSELMERIYQKLKPKIEKFAKEQGEEVEIWLQDKTNHHEIMASFRNEKVRSILFGTLTYFEGIDLKGEFLTQVILTRLPFSVPNHPIQKLLDEGYDYSRWEANIRFEQAFGRLIRSNKDYGTFSILDNRIVRFKEFLKPLRKEGVKVTIHQKDVEAFYKEKKKQ